MWADVGNEYNLAIQTFGRVLIYQVLLFSSQRVK